MGTKNNPGEFDCYANAKADEPMFVLLGRDRHAGAIVRLWALLRQRAGEDDAKIAEAITCADAMDTWARSLGKNPLDVPERHIIERLLHAATDGLDQHPDDYNDSCSCDSCLSYVE